MARAGTGERILLVTLSNIGDVVMTTPVMEALHARFPSQLLDCLGDDRSRALLEQAPYLGEIFTRDKRAGPRAQVELLRRLRRRHYDLVVDLRTLVIPFLLRTRRRLVKRRHDIPGLHAVEEHFSVVAPLFPAGTAAPRARVYPGAPARAEAARRLASLPGTRWLAVAPGANWPGKKWPATHYRALLDGAVGAFDAALVLGSGQDRADAAPLEAARLPLLNATGQTDLLLAAALLERAAAFVGNDSGLGHIAAAVGTPTLTVFGPGRPERYRPWGPDARIVQAPDGDLARLQPAAVSAELARLPVRAGD